MKSKILLLLSLAFCAPILILIPGCSTPVNERVQVVQSLKAVGQSAEATLELSAQLYSSGTINAIQANAVRAFYDNKFQPVFSTAVLAAHSDLTIASPDVQSLALQLASLLTSFLPDKKI